MTQDTSDTSTNDTTVLPTDDTTPTTQWGDDSSAQMSQLQWEIDTLREQLARAQADYSNLVRRTREEQSQMSEWAENKTILKFLTILDNLERALEHTPEEFKSHTWTEGLTSIVRAMQKIVSDYGISPMNAIGQEVNPDLHEVISQIPHADTTIQAQVETGYMRNDKALRHAKVIVGDGSIV